MGKNFFLTLVLLSVFLICSVNMSYAQPKGPPPDKKDLPDKKEISPEKMAEQTAGMLKRDLNLTDEQYKQIYDIVFTYHTSHNESNFDREELNAETVYPSIPASAL
jgi:Spy/CpxP family protein refolding chaperone